MTIDYDKMQSDMRLLGHDDVAAAIAALREQVAAEIVHCKFLREDLDAAEADNAALRKDTERYRWLREQAGMMGPKASVMFRKDDDWANVWDGLSLDAAIDALLAGKTKP